jgi:DNA-binding MarR family transcriptional regulator
MKLEEEIVQKKFKSETHKLGVNIIFTFNWLDAFHQRHFKSYGITPQQFNILRILRGQHPKPASVKLLKERMLDKMSDASRLVEKLRQKNLVERNIAVEDRRHCEVFITPQGLKLLSKIDSQEKKVEEIFSSLSEKEKKQLNDLLDKLRA